MHSNEFSENLEYTLCIFLPHMDMYAVTVTAPVSNHDLLGIYVGIFWGF